MIILYLRSSSLEFSQITFRSVADSCGNEACEYRRGHATSAPPPYSSRKLLFQYCHPQGYGTTVQTMSCQAPTDASCSPFGVPAALRLPYSVPAQLRSISGKSFTLRRSFLPGTKGSTSLARSSMLLSLRRSTISSSIFFLEDT